MKAFGQLLAGIVVMVLAGLAIFGIASVTTNNNTNNKNDTTTLSIQEARELVGMVCRDMGIVESNSNTLSTARVEEYPNDSIDKSEIGGDSYLQCLFFAKVALDESEVSEGFVKSVDTYYEEEERNATIYLAYKLQDNGVLVDMLSTSSNGYFGRIYLEVHSGSDKNSWALIATFLDVNNEIENYNQNTNGYASQVILLGREEKVVQYEGHSMQVDQSFYGDDLTKDNVTSLNSARIDAANHEKDAKCLPGEENDITGLVSEIGTYTDAEISQMVSYTQNYVKNAYSPKFYEINFKESDFLTRMHEVFGY